MYLMNELRSNNIDQDLLIVHSLQNNVTHIQNTTFLKNTKSLRTFFEKLFKSYSALSKSEGV